MKANSYFRIFISTLHEIFKFFASEIRYGLACYYNIEIDKISSGQHSLKKLLLASCAVAVREALKA